VRVLTLRKCEVAFDIVRNVVQDTTYLTELVLPELELSLDGLRWIERAKDLRKICVTSGVTWRNQLAESTRKGHVRRFPTQHLEHVTVPASTLRDDMLPILRRLTMPKSPRPVHLRITGCVSGIRLNKPLDVHSVELPGLPSSQWSMARLANVMVRDTLVVHLPVGEELQDLLAAARRLWPIGRRVEVHLSVEQLGTPRSHPWRTPEIQTPDQARLQTKWRSLTLRLPRAPSPRIWVSSHLGDLIMLYVHTAAAADVGVSFPARTVEEADVEAHKEGLLHAVWAGNRTTCVQHKFDKERMQARVHAFV